MSFCCIGGVCIPYSAAVPFLFLALKWVVMELISVGLLPASVANWVGGAGMAKTVTGNEDCCAKSACCGDEQQTGNGTNGDHPQVPMLRSEEEWKRLFASKQVVAIQFTATWCKPCKAIYPIFAQLSTMYPQASFCRIDVDDFDSIASEYKVAMMPTFVILSAEKQFLGRYVGSQVSELQAFCKQHLQTKGETDNNKSTTTT